MVSVLGAGLCVGGCGTSGHTTTKVKTPPVPPTTPETVTATDVTYEVRGPLPKRDLYYRIHTDRVIATVGLTVQSDGSFGTADLQNGVTGKVTGEITKDGQKTTFSADSARASRSIPKSKDLDVLTLAGHVVVHNKARRADLYCDRLRFEANKHMFKAIGNVRYNTANGTSGSLPEAWATEDLNQIASPELFGQKL